MVRKILKKLFKFKDIEDYHAELYPKMKYIENLRPKLAWKKYQRQKKRNE